MIRFKGKIISLFAGILFFACTNLATDKKPPKGIIKEDEFVLILTDIQIVEGLRSNKIVAGKDTLSHEFMKAAYEHIFSQHKTNAETFFESLSFYQDNSPETMHRMYEKVNKNLNEILNQPLAQP